MTLKPFLQPRLIGDRFTGHAIPLEMLKEISIIQEFILDVAKWQYFKDHPDRKRVPRGFTDGIELKLTKISDGSATLAIDLYQQDDFLYNIETDTYWEKARDTIINVINAASENKQISSVIEEKYLAYFDKLGRCLRDNESFEFTVPSKTLKATLTKGIRHRILESACINEITEEVCIRGYVPEVDQDDQNFEIQTIDLANKIKVNYLKEQESNILDAFTKYRKKAKIMIQGIGTYNKYFNLIGFESIKNITPLDTLDVPARLEELKILKEGWLGGVGKAPNKDGYIWFEKVFTKYYPEELTLPYIYPTEDGSLSLEWTMNSNEMSLEIDIPSHKGYWHNINLKTNEEDEEIFNLDDPKGWEKLSSKINELKGNPND